MTEKELLTKNLNQHESDYRLQQTVTFLSIANSLIDIKELLKELMNNNKSK